MSFYLQETQIIYATDIAYLIGLEKVTVDMTLLVTVIIIISVVLIA